MNLFYKNESINDIEPIYEKPIYLAESFKKDLNNHLEKVEFEKSSRIKLNKANMKILEGSNEDMKDIQEIYDKNINRLNLLNSKNEFI